jgi:hypothetical protein
LIQGGIAGIGGEHQVNLHPAGRKDLFHARLSFAFRLHLAPYAQWRRGWGIFLAAKKKKSAPAERARNHKQHSKQGTPGSIAGRPVFSSAITQRLDLATVFLKAGLFQSRRRKIVNSESALNSSIYG